MRLQQTPRTHSENPALPSTIVPDGDTRPQSQRLLAIPGRDAWVWEFLDNMESVYMEDVFEKATELGYDHPTISALLDTIEEVQRQYLALQANGHHQENFEEAKRRLKSAIKAANL